MAIDTSSPRTRRAILLGALGGVAASVAAAAGRASSVSAADGDVIYVGSQNSASSVTSLIAVGDSAFLGYSSSGNGIVGRSDAGSGLSGASSAEGMSSVHGLKDIDDGSGPAVKGENVKLTNGYAAVYGLTNGTGPGLFGENTKAGNGASGVAHGTGSGVYGQSALGRGGTFVGKKAQVNLQPSAAASHPASGKAGDLFVDKNHRLWFCKGATWKQLA